jgi:hypothetical protein
VALLSCLLLWEIARKCAVLLARVDANILVGKRGRVMIVTIIFAVAAVAGQPYGPDTCKAGFVWREATADDHVCVLPSVRDQARRDNAQASYRISPTSDASGKGSTCRQGYVWREATAEDHVCVLPEVREQTRRDNAAATTRYVSQ